MEHFIPLICHSTSRTSPIPITAMDSVAAMTDGWITATLEICKERLSMKADFGRLHSTDLELRFDRLNYFAEMRYADGYDLSTTRFVLVEVLGRCGDISVHKSTASFDFRIREMVMKSDRPGVSLFQCGRPGATRRLLSIYSSTI